MHWYRHIFSPAPREKVKEVAAYITPVPRGVGPLTVSMLLYNTLMAARLQHGRVESA